MRLGMAFEGCGSRAAFHIGVVEWMLDHDRHPDVLAGASSGSIVAAAVALGRGAALREMWLEVCGQPVFRPRRLLRGRWPMMMSEIVGGGVRRHLGGLNLRDLERPTAIAVTLLGARGLRRHVLTHEDDMPLTRAILGSCFFPGPYSRVITLERSLAIDGAWAVRTPAAELEMLGASRQIAVVTNPEGALETGFFRPGQHPPPPGCRVLAPLEPIPIGSWELPLDRTRVGMRIGYESADAFFNRNQAWLEG